MKRTTRMFAVPLAATALAATAGAGVAQASMSSSAAAVPTCATSGLSASLHTNLSGGMNHEGIELQLKNTTTHTCALLGYPGLGLEDSQHKTLTSHVSWGSTYYAKDPGKKVIDLAPGQSAQALIDWTHANIGTSGAVAATYLVVTPPANTGHKVLTFKHWVDLGDLEVTAVAHSVTINS